MPGLAELFDRDANAPATVNDVTLGSTTKRWWRCPDGPDHLWQATVPQISRALAGGFRGCPYCANRRLSETNSVAAKYPEWLHLWHPTRNSLAPEQTIANTELQVWWKCPAGPDHEWDEATGRIAANSWARGNTGCPCCRGIQVSVTNSLATVPKLAAEFHPTANGAMTPQNVVAGTGRKLWWLCPACGHEWQATGANRLKDQGCPMCKRYSRSVLEVCLGYELQTLFADLDLRRDKVVVDGRIRHVDFLLESAGLVVELDGSYHHEGRDAHDAAKSELLRGAGYRVVRVREAPLTATHPDDVLVPFDASVKTVADALIDRLQHRGWLDADAASAYLREGEPRRLAAALGEVHRQRPDRKIRIPGTPKGPTRRDRWEQRYGLLCAFVGREGHAEVPDHHVEEGVRLGGWVSIQRSRHRAGTLAFDRAARLAALPGWSWDPIADYWEAGYRHLLAYVAREGHTRVRSDQVEPDGFPLGVWARSHRRPGGGRRTMTDEQRQRLAAIPGWTFDSPITVFWERACQAAEAYAAREGHCHTPRKHVEDGLNLDAWLKQQRVRYVAGSLSPEQVSRLEALPGWSWRPQHDAWEAGFAALETFVAREGHALVPRDHREDDYPLGAWVGEQRNRRDDIDRTRRERLQTLPGWSFAPHEDTWERHFEALQRFIAREGHAGVPTDHIEEGLPLGSWVIRHRLERKSGRVPADRVARLSALPGWMWDTRDARWAKHLAALHAFVAREGHARVPSGHVEDEVKLGAWVVAVRARRKTGDLDHARADELEALPGWAWDARQAAWQEGFDALVAFVQRTGHAQVPTGHREAGYKLGQWVTIQRQFQRSGRLRQDRADRLAAVAGWHWGQQRPSYAEAG